MNAIAGEYDVIIVGGGPAGLTAGIYTARSGLNALILEEKVMGGLMAEAPFIENYPGLKEGVSGLDLANIMEMQARNFGAHINSPESVSDLKLDRNPKIIKTDRNTYTARAMILSLGCHYRKLGVLGENEFYGRGVSYCVACDGPFFRGKRVLVVGGGNSAASAAVYMSALASNVKLVHRRELLRADDILVKELRNHNVELTLTAVVKEIRGDTVVRSVVLEDVGTGERKSVEVEGVFIQIGEEPNSRLAKNAGVETDEEGYIVVDALQRTNLDGVYAAGDVTNCPVKQVGTAVGQAIIAALEAFAYVKNPYYIDGKEK